MGDSRKDRLHLRRLDLAACGVSFIAAASAPPGTLSGEPARVLTTFLGLVAASILPTISLIVGGLSAGNRSVKHLTELSSELSITVDALFAIFGLIAVSVVVLLLLNIPVPFSEYMPAWAEVVPNRLGQGVVAALFVLIVSKSGTIPGAIRRSLKIRTEMALDEAKRKTSEKASEALGEVGFRTSEGFGRVTKLEDLKGSDRTTPKN